MKLATVKTGSRDGALVLVKRDLSAWTPAGDLAPTLQAALDDWDAVAPKLRALAEALEAGAGAGDAVRRDAAARARCPAPTSGSTARAYINHILLVRKARRRRAARRRCAPTRWSTRAARATCWRPPRTSSLRDEAWGCDFESEVGVVLGDTPHGHHGGRRGASTCGWCCWPTTSPCATSSPTSWPRASASSSPSRPPPSRPWRSRPTSSGAAGSDGRVHLRAARRSSTARWWATPTPAPRCTSRSST